MTTPASDDDKPERLRRRDFQRLMHWIDMEEQRRPEEEDDARKALGFLVVFVVVLVLMLIIVWAGAFVYVHRAGGLQPVAH